MGNDQQRGYPGGYYTQIPSGAPPPVAQPNRSTSPPASSSTLASRPPSYGYQPPVPSGSAPAPAPAYYNPSYQYYEDDSASRSREERASAMSARVAKYKVKKRVSDQSKAANWKKYDDLGKTGEQQQGKPAAVGVGYRLADSMKVSGGNFHPNNNAPNTSSAAAAAGSKNPPEHKKAPSELSDDDFFEQQIATMSEKVRKMPIASVILLKKILANVLKTPEISTSSSSGSASAAEDPMKFRRLKLGSEKIMKEIINVDGALQLLFGVGFDEGVWNGEKVLTFHLKTPTDLVEVALEQLNELFPDTKTQAASANVTPTSSTTTLKKLPLSK